MRAWRVHRHGRPSEALELDDIPEPEPGPGTVRVRATATACNDNEVDGCRGRYLTVNPPLPYVLGMEATGVVDAAGPGAEAWVGRRVVATAQGACGGHAEAVIAPMDMVFDAPPTLDDTGAAAFFVPFHLASLGLHERGGLAAGETVLVHAAAGGAGVDLVFDGVGGEVGARSLGCLARNGRYLVVGDAVHTHLLHLLAAGAIRPIVGREVAFTELPAALEAMEQRETTGRVVVHLDGWKSTTPGA